MVVEIQKKRAGSHIVLLEYMPQCYYFYECVFLYSWFWLMGRRPLCVWHVCTERTKLGYINGWVWYCWFFLASSGKYSEIFGILRELFQQLGLLIQRIDYITHGFDHFEGVLKVSWNWNFSQKLKYAQRKQTRVKILTSYTLSLSEGSKILSARSSCDRIPFSFLSRIIWDSFTYKFFFITTVFTR